MNILILGLGSIGQRHLRNLRSIDKKIKFFSFRRKYITPLLDNKNRKKNGNIEKIYKIKNFKSFADINGIDIAFICTPSKFHVSEAIKLLKKDIHIFIEKPLGSSLNGVNKLKSIILKKPKIKTMMGFQLKFNPLILKLKKLIESNYIGKIYNLIIHHGERLDYFHPYEDYTISYAAKKNLGGGVILTQIHEIDYLMFLFKGYKIKILHSLPARMSNLKIDVEDNVVANLKLQNKKKKIICSLHLNYYENPKKREIKLIGEKGKIDCDLNKNEINIYKENSFKKIKFKIDKNEIFKKQIKYFLSCVKNKKKKVSKDFDVINGIKSLTTALRLK